MTWAQFKGIGHLSPPELVPGVMDSAAIIRALVARQERDTKKEKAK